MLNHCKFWAGVFEEGIPKSGVGVGRSQSLVDLWGLSTLRGLWRSSPQRSGSLKPHGGFAKGRPPRASLPGPSLQPRGLSRSSVFRGAAPKAAGRGPRTVQRSDGRPSPGASLAPWPLGADQLRLLSPGRALERPHKGLGNAGRPREKRRPPPTPVASICLPSRLASNLRRRRREGRLK